jgi:hypothetical protein
LDAVEDVAYKKILSCKNKTDVSGLGVHLENISNVTKSNVSRDNTTS